MKTLFVALVLCLAATAKDTVSIQVVDSTQGTATATSLDGSRVYSYPDVTLRAVLPDGSHFLLWCARQYRDCMNLTPGVYDGEIDGDKAVKLYVYGPLSHKFIGKIKYRLSGSW